MSKKITGQIVRVSRRRFLNGTAGAIATTAAVLLPQQTMGSDNPMSLEQMARALHQIVSRHSDLCTPFHFKGPDSNKACSFPVDFALERLRHSSVDEVQDILKLAIGGAS